jgi:hypothetical protein
MKCGDGQARPAELDIIENHPETNRHFHGRDKRVMAIVERIIPGMRTIAPRWEMHLLSRESWIRRLLLIWDR